jgi:hypothetical protein
MYRTDNNEPADFASSRLERIISATGAQSAFLDINDLRSLLELPGVMGRITKTGITLWLDCSGKRIILAVV